MKKSLSSKPKDPRKIISTNRRALGKYHIEESLEAGLALTGAEVKSLRAGKVNLSDGFVRIDNNEAYLWNVYISPYSHSSTHIEQEPTRTRKVLLHRREIDKWMGKAISKGLTVVPIEIYFNKKNKAKIKIGLAKGKTGQDRREDIKRRTVEREIRRDFAGKQRIR
jgi:SsrA-binding protein